MPPLSEALRKRGERPGEPTFDRLMRAGRDLFATEGFASASLDSVAAASGVTKGSLYHHFSSKTELFEAVFEDEARMLCEQVARVVAKHPDAWEGALPTLHLVGEHDPLTPFVPDSYRPYADDMRVELMAGCGHFIPEEAPGKLLERLEEFL